MPEKKRSRGRPRETTAPESLSQNVGRQIREQRCLRGLSVIECAADLDCDPGTWHRWEAGDRQIPLDLLPAIARCVRCEVEVFVK